jgi:L-cysteine desulfidase
MHNKDNTQAYIDVLKEELVIAIGCTEPVALALAAATLKEIFGRSPKAIRVRTSGAFFKNIRAAVVPGTTFMTGIRGSIAAGHVSGDPRRGLEVLENLSEGDLPDIRKMAEQDIFTIDIMDTTEPLHIILAYEDDKGSAEIEVVRHHTHVIRLEKDGLPLAVDTLTPGKTTVMSDRGFMRFDDIIHFIETVSPEVLRPLIEPVIRCNMAIAEEGMKGHYGVGIGPIILKKEPTHYGRLKAYAAAASEARMCGSRMPVVTNSGSGNQGMTASVPVIVHAKEHAVSEEKLIRALALSALFTIHQKSYIGRLSAFCGAVSAAASAGAAMTWLEGGTPDMIKNTVTNTLASASGILCDGAKGSCGFKIATELDAAVTGHLMALENKVYRPGAGIVRCDAEETITAVGTIATEGMKQTDKVILDMMSEPLSCLGSS